jgi:hypothetical protein
VAEAGELAGQSGVDRGAVPRAQDRGLADQEMGAPLADLPALQRRERVRHLHDQSPGEPDVPVALVRRLMPREGHLVRDPAALPLRRDTVGGLLSALGRDEADRDPGLRSGRGTLERLEPGEQVDPVRVGAVRLGSGQPLDEGDYLGGGRHRLLHGSTSRSPVASGQSNTCSILGGTLRSCQPPPGTCGLWLGSAKEPSIGICGARCRLGQVQ